MFETIKRYLGFLKNPDILLVAIILLTGSASFALGRLSALEENRESVTVSTASVFDAMNSKGPTFFNSQGRSLDSAPTASATQGQYVASKNGTKYHLPWCPGALQINDANKIWFDSKESAEKAGYAPASNCKGI